MKDNCFTCFQIVRLLILAFILSLVSSCGGGSSNSVETESVSKVATGVAQKGPYSLNSPVLITRLDASGDPTGETIATKVSTKKGGFEFEIPEQWINSDISNYYYIEVNGKAFDESSGKDSNFSISLTSYAQDINSTSINILTHWTAKRARKLMAEGKSISQSVNQSNDELKEIFGIDHVNKLDITSSEFASDNAMLLLLAGALMEVASANNVEPQLVIDELGDDFADNGELSASGDHWFIRMQAEIRDNPNTHAKKYAKVLKDNQAVDAVSASSLPASIPLASRPVADVPSVIYASPGETIILDASASHDSGEIINFTWFRVDQQQFVIPISDRFGSAPSITVPNQESVLLFAVIVTDADKLTDTAVIKVIVREPPPENNAPVADSQIGDQTVITNEDTPVNITLTGSDPDDDTINFIISTPLLLPNGLLEGTAPNLVYTPTANFHGTDHFTFQVDDGSLTSEVARVNIIVLPVNDPPVADDKTVVTDEDTPVTISLTGSDIENDPLSFGLGPKTPDNGSLSDTPPSIVYTPGTNFFGNDSFEYIANDGTDDSLPATVNIIVNPVNDPPIASPQTIETNEDTPVNIILTGSDIEGDSLSFNLGGISVQNGTLTGTPPNLTYVPNLDFNGDDSFNFTVNDGSDTSQLALVNITVLPVDDNTPPIAEAGNPQSVNSGDNVVLNGSGTDAEDGTNVTFEWTAPGGITLINSDTANPNFEAPNVTSTQVFTFSLIVRDTQDVSSAPDTVQITVNPANNPPIADAGEDITEIIIETDGGPETQLVMEGNTVQLDGSLSSDPDGDAITYKWTAPPGISFEGADDLVNPTFIAPAVGALAQTFTFSLVVTDSKGLDSVADTVDVTVSPTPPFAYAGADQNLIYPASAEGFTVNINDSSGFDPNGSIVSYEWTVVAELSDYSVNLDGDDSSNAPVSFSVNGPGTITLRLTVTDNDGLTDTDEVTINIYPESSKPSASVIFAEYCYDDATDMYTPVTITLNGFDPDGGSLMYSIETPLVPDEGKLDVGLGIISGNEVIYTPDVDPSLETIRFDYIVIDEQGLESEPATVSIGVCSA